MNDLEFSIPGLLPKEVNPNWRGHWSAKHRATKKLREDSRLCAISELNKQDIARPAFPSTTMSVVIVIPSVKYTKDQDNSLACLKAVIDGCVDAGVIPDDSGKHLHIAMPIVYLVDKHIDPEIRLRFRGRR